MFIMVLQSMVYRFYFSVFSRACSNGRKKASGFQYPQREKREKVVKYFEKFLGSDESGERGDGSPKPEFRSQEPSQFRGGGSWRWFFCDCEVGAAKVPWPGPRRGLKGKETLGRAGGDSSPRPSPPLRHGGEGEDPSSAGCQATPSHN